jgi:methyltransferase
MVILHTAFICSCGLEVLFTHRPFIPAVGYPMLALAIGAQIIRFYTISVLGKFWNARVIVVPERPVITCGLYKYIRHPNYLAVIVEIFALPMIHTAWITAIFFSILNAWMLTVRIRAEEQTLSKHCDYQDRFKSLGRFLPLATRSKNLEPK